MGLTVVKLERVEWDGSAAPRLFVSGVDLVDGTPVLDIKPYVPYADAIPEALRPVTPRSRTTARPTKKPGDVLIH